MIEFDENRINISCRNVIQERLLSKIAFSREKKQNMHTIL